MAKSPAKEELTPFEFCRWIAGGTSAIQFQSFPYSLPPNFIRTGSVC